MKILVTGGAGYIGSHTCVELLAAGHDVVIVDNFSNSSAVAVSRVEKISVRGVTCIECDVRDYDRMSKVLADSIDGVIHFAAFKAVGESCEKPLDYYDNNVGGTITLLRAMERAAVKRMVFSSSATVYGEPESLPIREDAKLGTTNPYGTTKLIVEELLRDYCRVNPAFDAVMLRYFNPVGAHESGLIGEDPRGIPNNLMPYVSQVAVGKREALSVFGNDYPTPDGTGVRDYIHVTDLAKAHVKAIELPYEGRALALNVGTGRGYSVLEVVRAFEKASGVPVPHEIHPRRAGDIAACYADPSLAHEVLGWKAELDLDDMCRDSWRWQSMNPNGYDG